MIFRVTLVLQVQQVKMAHLGNEVSLEKEACLALWLVLLSAQHIAITQIQYLPQLGYCIIVLGY